MAPSRRGGVSLTWATVLFLTALALFALSCSGINREDAGADSRTDSGPPGMDSGPGVDSGPRHGLRSRDGLGDRLRGRRLREFDVRQRMLPIEPTLPGGHAR